MTDRKPKEGAADGALTRKHDLRTGRPIWSAHRRPSIQTHALTRDIKTDIAIVGAGITEALIAETMTEAGLRVVIVDRRGPVEGSTAAFT